MYTLNVVMETAIGIKFPVAGHTMTDMLEAFHIFSGGLASPGFNLPFTQFRKSLEARKKLVEIIREVSCAEKAAYIEFLKISEDSVKNIYVKK